MLFCQFSLLFTFAWSVLLLWHQVPFKDCSLRTGAIWDLDWLSCQHNSLYSWLLVIPLPVLMCIHAWSPCKGPPQTENGTIKFFIWTQLWTELTLGIGLVVEVKASIIDIYCCHVCDDMKFCMAKSKLGLNVKINTWRLSHTLPQESASARTIDKTPHLASHLWTWPI